MKTILLPIDDDIGADARMQVALDVARAVRGHLSCVQVTPMSAFIVTSEFGGVFVLNDVADAIEKHEARLRSQTEARLGREDVPWDYTHVDGSVPESIVSRADLADLIVLAPAVGPERTGDPLPLAGGVAVHARVPVLVVPQRATGFPLGAPALIAWNGRPEAAAAIRSALPLLRFASSITVVTVAEPDPSGFPATEACEYLSRHGLKAELREVDAGTRGVADALLATREALGAGYVVMGAYGHSRLRELLLGGVTRQMLRDCPVPMLLAH
jgi:nucleotide-binding universal stress UspA family protein